MRRIPLSHRSHIIGFQPLREDGNRHVDEGALFRTIEAMHKIVDGAKSARRQRERRLRLIQGGRMKTNAPPHIKAPVASGEVDQGRVQPWEQMLPVEEWI